jgi:hypothetical protein
LLQAICSTQQIDYRSNFGGDLFQDATLNGISNTSNNKGLVCTLTVGAEVNHLCTTGKTLDSKAMNYKQNDKA